MTRDRSESEPDVRLTSTQRAAMRRHLQSALDGIDALDHLCEVRQHASRIEDGISAAIYILDRATAVTPADDDPATT